VWIGARIAFISMFQSQCLKEGEKLELDHSIADISIQTSQFLLVLSPNNSAEKVDVFCTLNHRKILPCLTYTDYSQDGGN